MTLILMTIILKMRIPRRIVSDTFAVSVLL